MNKLIVVGACVLFALPSVSFGGMFTKPAPAPVEAPAPAPTPSPVPVPVAPAPKAVPTVKPAPVPVKQDKDFSKKVESSAKAALNSGKPQPPVVSKDGTKYEIESIEVVPAPKKAKSSTKKKEVKVAVLSIDELYDSRRKAECKDGFFGVICRETLKYELCKDKYSATPPNGESLCLKREPQPGR